MSSIGGWRDQAWRWIVAVARRCRGLRGRARTCPEIGWPHGAVMQDLELPDVEATERFAALLAGALEPGDVVLLDGPMGAGKTTCTRALVAALGGDPACVSSPSFTLLHRYQARLPVVHVDAWRLSGDGELEGLGFDEARAGGVAVVEWAERIASAFAPGSCWRIALAHVAGGGRRASVEPPAERRDAWLRILSQEWTLASSMTITASEPDPSAVPLTTTPESGAPSATAKRVADRSPIVRIDAESGVDPLVRTYLANHLDTCAHRTLSWTWLVVGAALALAAALAAQSLFGQVRPLPPDRGALVEWFNTHLGDPWAVLPGLAVGALLASVLGVLKGSQAKRRVASGQEPLLAGIVLAALWLPLYDPLLGTGVLAGVLTLVYLVVIVFRLLALTLGWGRGLRRETLNEPADGWPVYTVLVPLYRERAVARNILRSLEALDYPRERLDVKFLLEADDPETLAALESAGIPSYAEVVIVPAAQPKTKPRACNHGLLRARGDLLVIFDAEDRPDPDQLKQAVLAFASLDARVVCLQAQLAYHNHAQNLLTRWFALEYNVWFRRYLPGLVRLGVPIPLGGTSNHFRTAALRDLGGWDPFNVTEDCDLGVRLHLHGWRTRTLDSTTWEEANSRVGNWIRQRSRWIKGYMVTHLVWCRNPLWLLLRLGPWGAFGFLCSVAAFAALAVLNLGLWLISGIQALAISIDLMNGHRLMELLTTRDLAHDRWSWPIWFAGALEDPTSAKLSQIFCLAALVMLAGNLLFVLINYVAGRRPGQRGLELAALISPLYWLLISVAAFKGLIQLITKPHYWEKTVHGLDQ